MNSSVTTYLNTFVYKRRQRHIVCPTEEERNRFSNDSINKRISKKKIDEETMSAQFTQRGAQSTEKITINDADT